MFYGCSSLSFLPDISKWNIFEMADIKGIFKGCTSLVYCPYISKLGIDHISLSYSAYDSKKEDMIRNYFSGCINAINIK